MNTPTLPFYPTPQETFVSSPHGQLCIRTVCSPESLHPLTLEDGIGRFARYRSIISGVATLEKVAALPDANVTVALSPERRIIGYIECSYPDAIEGWRENTDGLCYELGAIEVSRNWRHVGIGKAMVAAILTGPFIDKMLTATFTEMLAAIETAARGDRRMP